MKNFMRGVTAGLPIGLGYLSVSFTFGIMAVSAGLSWWQATLVSMCTVTSAGQFAGLTTMLSPGQYVQMLIAQITINIRYSFMSISLSQKTDTGFRGIWRWIFGFMMTDEIFAVASQEDRVSRSFFAGLSLLPYLGWSVGTLVGALLGNVLPDRLMSALGIAIYSMFVAIVIPEMKKSRPVVFAVVIASLCRCGFTYIPLLGHVSDGIAITVCAVAAAALAAVLFPVENKEDTCNG
ncbi:MAG: AzlC family ABC transporter permease [Blautia sp.]|nr:AzlC family ABC transporter permease [Blautia sp.]